MAPIMRHAFVALAVLILSLPVAARQTPTGNGGTAPERVTALKQALAANQAALKQYTWTETTEISLKGEVKKRQQKSCRYGADGKVVKTEVAGEQPQQAQEEQRERGGRRRGAAVAK